MSASAALFIEEAAAAAQETKRCLSRRSLLISASVAVAVVIAVVITVAVVLSHKSASSSSSPAPTPVPQQATVTYGRGSDISTWKLGASASASGSSRAASTDSHSFQWLFPQRNQAWLASEFQQLSDPSSARFQQWKEFDEIMAMMGPSQEAKQAVLSFLKNGTAGGDKVLDHGDIIDVRTTVGAVEAMFGVELHEHYHSTTGMTAVLSIDGKARVPAGLSQHLTDLRGVYNYPMPITHLTSALRAGGRETGKIAPRSPSAHSFHTMAETNKQCKASYTGEFIPLVSPAFLATAYNFTSRATSTAAVTTRPMVTAFGGQAYYPEDLTLYRTNIGYSAKFKPTVYNEDDNYDNLYDYYGIGIEADLDIQALYQITPTSDNAFYANTASATFLQTVTAIAAMSSSSRPQVVSFSYGFAASDYSYNYTDHGATDTKLQQLGVLGVTIIVAAGDDGAPGYGNCSTNPNSLGYGPVTTLDSSPLLPAYPAASAYVLSVGETDFLQSATSESAAAAAFSTATTSPAECNNCPADQSGVAYLCQAKSLGEEPVSLAAPSQFAETSTGGGFSLIYPRPSWQSTVVNSYLNTNCVSSNGCVLPSSSFYYSGNRGFPDVSAFGGYFGLVLGEEEGVVSGTSVAAPLWCGFVSRMNEINIARKGATLGFINPLLYAMSAAQPNTFHDLTTGENFCPETNTACVDKMLDGRGSTSCSGFYSAPGWDPVTGLGSPNIGNILQYLNTH